MIIMPLLKEGERERVIYANLMAFGVNVEKVREMNLSVRQLEDFHDSIARLMQRRRDKGQLDPAYC